MKHNYLILIALISYSFAQAQIINFPDANLESNLLYYNCADLDGDGIVDDDVDINNDGFIQVSEAESVFGLRLDFFQNLVDLTGLEYFTNLEMFTCTDNQGLTNLNVITAFPNLKILEASECSFTSLDVSQNLQLERLVCSFNQITDLDVSNNLQLNYLECNNNQIASLNLFDHVNLEQLSCQFNALSNLILPNNSSLLEIYCHYNQLTNIDVTTCPDLQFFDCGNNLLTSLDLSNTMNLVGLWSSGNDFLNINIKNGVYDQFLGLPINNIIRSPNLEFVCIDETDEEYNRVQQLILETLNPSYAEVNSYCSFVPGGEFFTIEGQSTLDLNADGCDMNDIIFPNLRFNITNGSESGTIFSNEIGAFSIPVLEGIHSITPLIENPDYFNISPESFTVDFPTDASQNMQDFCITANGVHKDMDVIIIPLTSARPGFNASYRIIYSNIGNTTIDFGQILLTNDYDLMTEVQFTPSWDSFTFIDNAWHFNYDNLLPFESRTIDFTMNINAPTDDPAVNGGDVITFIANYFIEYDEIDPVTAFELHQTVVNSFDPNDKTCLQGETITLEQIGKYVHYTIRFENTGTADAINIVVKDAIDMAKFDISTLIPLEASHSFVTRIKDYNIVEFIFEDINLAFDDANNDGYVVFKIKTLETLALGDTFANDAEIYFDYNAPIITNDEVTTVEESLRVTESTIQDIVKIYPNPVSNTLFIESKNTLETIFIYDVNGRQLQSISLIGNKRNTEINASVLSKGIYFVKIKTEVGVQTTKIIKN